MLMHSGILSLDEELWCKLFDGNIFRAMLVCKRFRRDLPKYARVKLKFHLLGDSNYLFTKTLCEIPDSISLKALKVPQLKSWCGRIGMRVSGRKDELIGRLHVSRERGSEQMRKWDFEFEGKLRFLQEFRLLQSHVVFGGRGGTSILASEAVHISSRLIRIPELKCIEVARRLDSSGVERLAEALKQAPGLTRIELNGGCVSWRAPAALSQALQCTPALTELALRNCQIDQAGAKAIADALPRLPLLSHFDISSTDVGDQGVQHLAKALALNPRLTEVRMMGCSFGGEGAKYLAEMMKFTPELRKLDVRRNRIGFSACQELHECMPHGCALEVNQYDFPDDEESSDYDSESDNPYYGGFYHGDEESDDDNDDDDDDDDDDDNFDNEADYDEDDDYWTENFNPALPMLSFNYQIAMIVAAALPR